MNAAPSFSVALVCGARHAGVDGIHDYASQLGAALRRRGAESSVFELDIVAHTSHMAAWDALQSTLADFDVVALQYNPFAFGHRGIAPWLVPAIRRFTHARARPSLVLMAHERYVDPETLRWLVLSALQRAQFGFLRSQSELVTTTVGLWAKELQQRTGTAAVHLPVGSNLPCATIQPSAARASHKIATDTFVIGTFGTDHPTRLISHIVGAANEAARHRHVVVCNLGANARALPRLDPQVRELRPGPLAAPQLAAMLRCTDVFLHPLADGLSTKRTTLMAALQHALPIVATRGRATDPMLEERGNGIQLVDRDAPRCFARAVELLAADPGERTRRSAAARAFFERCFCWDILADRLLVSLQGIGTRDYSLTARN